MKHIGWLRVLLFIIPYFFVVGIFQWIAASVCGTDIINNPDFEKTPQEHLIMSFFSMMGTFLIVWIFIKFVDKEKFINLGLDIKNRGNDIFLGTGIGAFLITTSYIVLLVSGEINFIGFSFDPGEMILTVLFFLIVALTEEVVLRGYVLKNFMRSFNKYTALMVSSALFALMHAFNPNISIISLISLFIAGLLLGASYIYTRNLWFPVALHFSWNLFQTFYGFNVSGIDTYSVIEFKITESNLFNGGTFGLEGSILAMVAMFVTTILIIRHYRKKMVNG